MLLTDLKDYITIHFLCKGYRKNLKTLSNETNANKNFWSASNYTRSAFQASTQTYNAINIFFKI